MTYPFFPFKFYCNWGGGTIWVTGDWFYLIKNWLVFCDVGKIRIFLAFKEHFHGWFVVRIVEYFFWFIWLFAVWHAVSFCFLFACWFLFRSLEFGSGCWIFWIDSPIKGKCLVNFWYCFIFCDIYNALYNLFAEALYSVKLLLKGITVGVVDEIIQRYFVTRCGEFFQFCLGDEC